MRIGDLLVEAPSGVLFYARGLAASLDILKSNSFRLSPTFTEELENHDKYLYYMSTARARTGSYHRNRFSSGVLFKLDGRRLGYNLKSIPVNQLSRTAEYSPSRSEAEDRLLSNNPTIPNATRYITGLDIFVHTDNRGRFPTREVPKIRSLINECVRHNIPYRVYDNEREWVSGDGMYLSKGELEFSLNTDNTYGRPTSDMEKAHMKPTPELILVHKLLTVIGDESPKFNSNEYALIRLWMEDKRLGIMSIMDAISDNTHRGEEARDIIVHLGEVIRYSSMTNTKQFAEALWRQLAEIYFE